MADVSIKGTKGLVVAKRAGSGDEPVGTLDGGKDGQGFTVTSGDSLSVRGEGSVTVSGGGEDIHVAKKYEDGSDEALAVVGNGEDERDFDVGKNEELIVSLATPAQSNAKKILNDRYDNGESGSQDDQAKRAAKKDAGNQTQKQQDQKPKEPADMSNDELRAELTAKGVQFAPNTSANDLQKMVADKRAQDGK